MSTTDQTSTELEGPDPTLSPDARDSTYAPAPTDRSAENPPPGPQVIQTLGKAGSGGGGGAATTRPAPTKTASSS